MKFALTAALLSASASAFPAVMQQRDIPAAEIDALFDEADIQKRATPGQTISQAEGNCGAEGPCLTFIPATQKPSISGVHKYANPGPADIRGPCPGLNAAANHGYLPRNGVATIPETVVGLGQLYGMSPDLAGFLAAYAVVLDGDLVSQSWSIGGPPPYNAVPGLTSPQGISYSHNKYEGDTSIGRPDAYLNNGNAYSLQTPRFAKAYAAGQQDGSDRYTLDKFRQLTGANQIDSIQNNPYYFAPLFSTTLVAPAAYNFVINFMSNHSAENPNGYLDGSMFKQFFSVKGNYNPNAADGGFTWAPGLERVPNNWYRRPLANAYNAINVFQDLAIAWAAYPDTFRFGGNTNGVNTYQGIDIATLTGGTYTNTSALKPKNFACLIFQTQQQAIPDQLKGGVNDVAAALALIQKFSQFTTALGCPKLAKYDNSVFNKYPGHTYSPTAPNNNGS